MLRIHRMKQNRYENVQISGEPNSGKMTPAKLRYYLEPRVVNASYLYGMITTYIVGVRLS